jgi:hypothetical protein
MSKLPMFYDTVEDHVGVSSTEAIPISIQGRQVSELVLTTGPGLAVTEAEYNDETSGLTLLLSLTDAQPPVYAISTSDIATLSGNATVDGESIPNGARLALAGQTTGSENGFWIMNTSGAWTRATPAPKEGHTVEVLRGDIFAGTFWIIATVGTITVGTTAIALRRIDGRLVTYAVADANHTVNPLSGRCYIGYTSIGTNVTRTVTLPDASLYDGQEVIVQAEFTNFGTSLISIAAPAGQDINGGASISLNQSYGRRSAIARGGNWFAI